MGNQSGSMLWIEIRKSLPNNKEKTEKNRESINHCPLNVIQVNKSYLPLNLVTKLHTGPCLFLFQQGAWDDVVSSPEQYNYTNKVVITKL